MRILKEQSVGAIIDVQEKLYPHIYKNEPLTKNLKKLIKGLKILDIPMIVTEQYTKGIGPTIPDISEVIGEYTPIEKRTFSCYDTVNFKETLHNRVTTQYVIIAGIETHVCVLQTALDLLETGYTPVIVEDCVSSRKKHDKKMAIHRLRAEGAIITTYESLLFELCRTSQAKEFKAISKLVK